MHVAPGQTSQRRRWRRVLRWAFGLALLALVAVGFWLRGALYNRWVRFPQEERAWAAFRAQRQPVAETAGWAEYRGILHSHSHLSHDCEVPFERILEVLKMTGIDFIGLSDHCSEGRADFSVQWRGLREGKLFIPGFEMKEGIMPFGVVPGIVLSNRTDSALLAAQIAQGGGVLFYAHPEEKRAWDRPELTGMELYNIHADLKTGGRGLGSLVPDLLLSLNRYPDHIFRLIFHRPTAVLQRWDELNRTRHITGIAGNDCHQNTGFRAFCTSSNTFRIEDTSPRRLAEFKLNPVTRLLARLCFGSLEPGRRLFHVQLDPYERMGQFVNTHLLARELTEPEILQALRAGRAFIGFDRMADSTGFRWLAQGSAGQAAMGETLAFSPDTRLAAHSPLPCRFTVVRNGQAVHRQEGRQLQWRPPGPGKYRVEAELQVRREWVPWIYANPIELR